MRIAILGEGAWQLISSEKQMRRLQNSPRERRSLPIPEWLFR